MSVMPSCLRTTPGRDSLDRTILQSGAMKTPTGSSGSNSEPCRLPDTRLIAYGLAHVLGLVIAKAVHGARLRAAAGCRAAGRAVRDPEPRRLARWLTILTARQRRVALASRPDLATLKRWLRRERTLLTAVAAGASPAALAELLLAADTDRGS